MSESIKLINNFKVAKRKKLRYREYILDNMGSNELIEIYLEYYKLNKN